MEELTEQEIIENCIQNGTMEVLEFEAIPKGAERTRVTKSRYTLGNNIVEVETVYAKSVTSNSIYAISTQIKTLL